MDELEINDNKKVVDNNELSNEYIEDNSLKIFLDDTIDLGEVVSDIADDLSKENTNEIKLDE